MMLDAEVEAAIAAEEHDVAGIGGKAGAFEQELERRAGPLGGADGLVMPRLTAPARRDGGAAVAGAFQRHAQRACGKALELIEAKAQRPLDAAADGKRPGGARGHVGHVEVDQQIVQAERRQVVAQRLQERAGIAVGEQQFLARERLLGGLARLGVEDRMMGAGHGMRRNASVR